MNSTRISQHNLDPDALRLTLPEGPGVYLFKDPSGRIIYVGKAKNLKKRVLSYFRPLSELPYKTALMMNRAKGLDYILTATETEAFILESNLVKKHLPRYNIVLRDDKQYPCLRLDVKAPYPRLSIVRRIKKDGARYFGPFSSAQDVRKTLKLIDGIFQLRKCRTPGLPKRSRPCLNYQLNRCLGLCSRNVPVEDYREVVDQVRLFLEGRNLELTRQLRRKMETASTELKFEEAARLRDQIKAVEHIIGLEELGGIFQIVILFVRKGYLTGSRDFEFKGKGGTPSEVMEAFLKQYYHREIFIPPHILISEPIEDHLSINDWVSGLAKRRVSIDLPQRGEKVRLIRMAKANALNLLETRAESGPQDLAALAGTLLKLDRPPRSIEGMDISNIQGELPVGAVVSFVDGLPNKGGYRNYRIRDVEGIDDYGMMAELVTRRMKEENLPDLFLVDGGKGHLMAVKKAADAFQRAEAPALAAIAKGAETGAADRVYLPGRKNPLPLRSDNPLLHLFMRIRDEAHRRAVTYHRKLRQKKLITSELDRIPGIGPKRKRLLLKHFGDTETIRKRSLDDLMKVPGISPSLAREIKQFLG